MRVLQLNLMARQLPENQLVKGDADMKKEMHSSLLVATVWVLGHRRESVLITS